MKFTLFTTLLLVQILVSGIDAGGGKLKKEIASIKAQLAKAGSFAVLDQEGNLPRDALPGGYDKYSANDLGWQSLHMAAAAACRGSTPTGGSGCCGNVVLVRNTAEKKTCTFLCSQTQYKNCDAEVSIHGYFGKATQNGQMVGSFYNYPCNYAANGGSEVSDGDEAVMRKSGWYYSFCCCRK